MEDKNPDSANYARIETELHRTAMGADGASYYDVFLSSIRIIFSLWLFNNLGL